MIYAERERIENRHRMSSGAVRGAEGSIGEVSSGVYAEINMKAVTFETERRGGQHKEKRRAWTQQTGLGSPTKGETEGKGTQALSNPAAEREGPTLPEGHDI